MEEKKMIPLQYELDRVLDNTHELLDLIRFQLENAQKALLKNDIDAAEDILGKELRVNALELNLDHDCESILALHTPVASDLRLVIALLKISDSLERIGDHAFHIGEYVVNHNVLLEGSLFKDIQFEEMFKIILQMTDDIQQALESEKLEDAKKIWKQDKKLNKLQIANYAAVRDTILNNPESIQLGLYIVSISNKLERCGDLIKNIAEEIIYYDEAKVLRHKKRKKEILKKYK